MIGYAGASTASGEAVTRGLWRCRIPEDWYAIRYPAWVCRAQLGPETVKSRELDDFLPSSVQMAPVASQSVVAGRAILTAAFEFGSTVIVQPMLLPFTCRLACFTVPPSTVVACPLSAEGSAGEGQSSGDASYGPGNGTIATRYVSASADPEGLLPPCSFTAMTR